jgi:kynureninase
MQPLIQQLCSTAGLSEHAIADEAFARALDAQDKVIRRDAFAYPQLKDGSADCIYFCGNSLGLQPLAARSYINQELDAWAKCDYSAVVFAS